MCTGTWNCEGGLLGWGGGEGKLKKRRSTVSRQQGSHTGLCQKCTTFDALRRRPSET